MAAILQAVSGESREARCLMGLHEVVRDVVLAVIAVTRPEVKKAASPLAREVAPLVNGEAAFTRSPTPEDGLLIGHASYAERRSIHGLPGGQGLTAAILAVSGAGPDSVQIAILCAQAF